MRTRIGSKSARLEGRRPAASPVRAALALLAGLLVVAAACAERELTLPAESELSDLYGPAAEVRLDGNVVAVRVEQDATHLQRGGAIWARAGPYIFLFSPQTRDIFREYDGVAAVRVRTERGPRGDFIAEATLRRDTMTTVAWGQARQKVTRARQEGTERPWYLEDLIRFGEDWASYEYATPYRHDSADSDGP